MTEAQRTGVRVYRLFGIIYYTLFGRAHASCETVVLYVSAYCNMVVSIANVELWTILCERETSNEDTDLNGPANQTVVGGNLVHDEESTPARATTMTYDKSPALVYSESVVFERLNTLYKELQIREEAAVYAANYVSQFDNQYVAGHRGNGFETERGVDNITESFGYIFFSRYSNSPTNLSELMRMLNNVLHEIHGSVNALCFCDPHSSILMLMRNSKCVYCQSPRDL